MIVHADSAARLAWGLLQRKQRRFGRTIGFTPPPPQPTAQAA